VAAAVVDAASTEVSTSEQRLKIRVDGILHAESVKIMLDYIYQVGTGNAWEYSPSSLDVNKEVLKLSRQFRLNHLQEYAARWLTRGLNTKNLVERLMICEEFKLGMLREKLIEQLTANPAELGVVCRSTEVLAHPTILQDLLVQVSSLCGMTGWQPHRSSPQKREAPEESTEEKVSEKIAEEEKTEKAPEKLSTKVDKPLEKNTEDERPEKLKPDKDKTEKTSAKASVKVPPLKKKRTQ
jgi:tRNA nucleotidyltransferase/poly(A) polymerase